MRNFSTFRRILSQIDPFGSREICQQDYLNTDCESGSTNLFIVKVSQSFTYYILVVQYFIHSRMEDAQDNCEIISGHCACLFGIQLVDVWVDFLH